LPPGLAKRLAVEDAENKPDGDQDDLIERPWEWQETEADEP